MNGKNPMAEVREKPPHITQFGLAKHILFAHVNPDLIGTCIIKIDNYHTNNLQLLKHVKYVAHDAFSNIVVNYFVLMGEY